MFLSKIGSIYIQYIHQLCQRGTAIWYYLSHIWLCFLMIPVILSWVWWVWTYTVTVDVVITSSGKCGMSYKISVWIRFARNCTVILYNYSVSPEKIHTAPWGCICRNSFQVHEQRCYTQSWGFCIKLTLATQDWLAETLPIMCDLSILSVSNITRW